MSNFLASFTLSTERNDYGGFIGVSFVAVGSGISVSQLGLRKGAGSIGVHTAYLIDATAHAILASAGIDLTAASVGAFVYGSIAPTSLTLGNPYYLVTKGNIGDGQNWADSSNCALALGFGSPMSIFNGSTTDPTSGFAPHAANQSYYGLDMVFTMPAGKSRVSTAYAEVISSGDSKNRVSTAYVEVIGSGQQPKNRVSTLYLEVIAAPSPLHKRRNALILA